MELVTIAKPYANAVFEIAQQDKSHNDWKVVLEAAASLVIDEQLQDYLESPNATKQDKSSTIQKLVASVVNRKLATKENEFLSLILDNGRTEALPSILSLFEDRSNAFDEAKAFHVISAYKLTAAEEKSIVADLSEKYNAGVSIETTIDDSLIGGLIIKLGDKVIDMSIKARTDELNLLLTTH
ncbi:F0F1 ATP synthase subunit delta [Candidatus Thioglobus autotrophicus]|uniref:F0F1 ATP synthase subunit delta n=1 Tax=Candidatus Thioglobus autotrophicus TaxID=1705394 RepID=UPI00299E4008|nr:F0F1 ATP synthase subunit delta [Candidatus Thioglobus autotrophicus]WPE17976.1 F0F1 ATP synthase subunit delta [Candidatus Thioglobus autotrophicus]